MNTIELNQRVQELRELRRMADELSAEMEGIQDEIKAHMTAQGVEELSGTDFKISWKEVKTTRFDKKAMIQTFGQDCYNEFCKTTTSRRFTVA
jgi:predicted phage-related endonuclease